MAAAMDAGALLKELDALWGSYGKDQQSGVLRACAMTLIVVAGADEDPQALGATLAEIMHAHPNRSIVVRVGGTAPLAAHTSVQCWMPSGGRRQICCEQVEIDTPVASLDAVPPILLGLMVADLPVALWLKDLRLAGVAALAPLLGLAGKVIVDTAQCASVGEALGVLRGLGGGSWQVADLAWARITRWREMIPSPDAPGTQAA